MTIEANYLRPLGTMVAYGFDTVDLAEDLALAHRLGAKVLEIFPEWRTGARPQDPQGPGVRRRTRHPALAWCGGQSIRADRVDLGSPTQRHRESVADLQRCVDWLNSAGGTCLVVHPGGLADPADSAKRRAALADGLMQLAEHARGLVSSSVSRTCPRGQSRQSNGRDLRPGGGTRPTRTCGCARYRARPHLGRTRRRDPRLPAVGLRTTHVHDNQGRQDTHEPPELGTNRLGGLAASARPASSIVAPSCSSASASYGSRRPRSTRPSSTCSCD